jgi:hypothetical protein
MTEARELLGLLPQVRLRVAVVVQVLLEPPVHLALVEMVATERHLLSLARL